MGSVRCTDLQTRPTEVLDVTSLPVEECQRVAPPFEAALQAQMVHWRLDGQPRTARRYTTDQNGPWPTPEDRLLLILVYLQTYPRHVVQGRRFGMGQRKAHQWMHVWLVVLPATRHTLGDAPARSLTERAKRLGVAAAAMTAMVVRPEQPPAPAALPAPAPPSPLWGLMVPSGASGAPRIRLRRRAVSAARKRATR